MNLRPSSNTLARGQSDSTCYILIEIRRNFAGPKKPVLAYTRLRSDMDLMGLGWW